MPHGENSSASGSLSATVILSGEDRLFGKIVAYPGLESRLSTYRSCGPMGSGEESQNIGVCYLLPIVYRDVLQEINLGKFGPFVK